MTEISEILLMKNEKIFSIVFVRSGVISQKKRDSFRPFHVNSSNLATNSNFYYSKIFMLNFCFHICYLSCIFETFYANDDTLAIFLTCRYFGKSLTSIS